MPPGKGVEEKMTLDLNDNPIAISGAIVDFE
jgi:hypothetical protein